MFLFQLLRLSSKAALLGPLLHVRQGNKTKEVGRG